LSKWLPRGGGRAHARALVALGFRCEKRTATARIMYDGKHRVVVPSQPLLPERTLRQIWSAAGVSATKYRIAFRNKPADVPCPEDAQYEGVAITR
jgi:hypothetical protein